MKQKKNIALNLNEDVLSLIQALNKHYKNDPELKMHNMDLKRLSKFLNKKSLIKVDHEKD